MLLKALILSQHVRRGACVQAVHLPVELESQAPCRNVGFPGLGGPGVGALGGAAVPASTAGAAGPATAPAPMAARGNAAVEKGGRKKDPFADLLG